MSSNKEMNWNHPATLKNLTVVAGALVATATLVSMVHSGVVVPLILSEAADQTRAIVAEHAKDRHVGAIGREELAAKLDLLRTEIRSLSQQIEAFHRRDS